MKITPTTLTISELLSSESTRFVIPAYQRRYAWKLKQVTELFDDINKLDGGESHLLGSIVCLTKYFQAGINDLELVDGQQRMTTIMLFINAIEERLKKDGREEDARDIGKYLYAKDLKGGLSNKLILGDLDSKDFQNAVSYTHLTLPTSRLV